MDMRVRDGISLADLAAQAVRAGAVVAKVRGAVLAPEARKQAPGFTLGQVMQVSGLEKRALEYRITRGDVPAGVVTGGRRQFTLAEAQQIARWARPAKLRPQSAQAVTVAVANFKGGVAKTTTALTLAQALSLRGHRVLVVDCDPQGSLTSLFGILPDEVAEADTMLPLVVGNEASLAYAVRGTYWSGIDLVAAAPFLFGAEFALANRQHVAGDGPEFWQVLDAGLQPLRADYDVIIIDTPPALGYVTINALLAADGLLMPVPPSQPDFVSSAQFWQLFSEIAQQLADESGKRYSFVDIVASRVDTADASAAVVKEWLGAAYDGFLLQLDIPKSAATAATAVQFGTVYDSTGETTRQTHKRALDAYERLADVIEEQAGAYWRHQGAAR